ncbi:MAG: hypothetical protein LBP24_01310 [Coriobacteriales bacterium]|jgi:hypothetical protein|nr:hypothetical protein [Coriobacteriales bacterium]
MAETIDINITELGARIAELKALFEDGTVANAHNALACSSFYRSGGLCAEDLTALIWHFSMMAVLTNILIQRTVQLFENVAAGFVATDEQLAAAMQTIG